MDGYELLKKYKFHIDCISKKNPICPLITNLKFFIAITLVKTSYCTENIILSGSNAHVDISAVDDDDIS